MDDMISRISLLRELEKLQQNNPHKDAKAKLQHRSEILKCMHIVSTQPSVDARPVVHGKWIYENYTWHCNLCNHHPFKGYIPEVPGYNFCPNCGADMRKGS